MAELNGELPQTQAQGSVGGVSPNLEAMTAAGRGLSKMGSEISEGGAYLYRKSAQNEVANVYADISAARENYTEELNNALATGQLDTEEFANKLKAGTDKIGEGLSTPEGRNFFERQQARLTGAMLLKASHIKGQIAYAQTVDQFNTAVDLNSNTAMKDPSQFADMIDQNEEMIDAAVKSGQIPLGRAEELRKAFNTKIADGAAKGLAQMDPGKNPDGTPKENLLLATLKRMDPTDKNDNASFFKYLNADQIANLEGYARQMDHVRAVQEEQVSANQEKLLRLKGQVYLNQHSAAILSGQMDPKTIINNPNLTIEQKNMAIEMIRRQSRESVETDRPTYNHIEDKIINNEITSWDQLVAEKNANPGKISGDDFFKLAGRINSTPDGQIIKGALRELYKMGDQELKFKGVGNAPTAEGNNRNYAFRQELEMAAQQFVASGKGSLRDFYQNHNPNDQLSPIAILNKYRLTPTQKAQLGAQEAMAQANGQNPGAIQYSTSPTKDIPQLPPKPTIRPEESPKPGESIEDWEKRVPPDKRKKSRPSAANSSINQEFSAGVNLIKEAANSLIPDTTTGRKDRRAMRGASEEFGG